MGREIIQKGTYFPASQKNSHAFFFTGYENLSQLVLNHELAAKLEEINAMPTSLRVSFFGKICANRTGDLESDSFDESLAKLSSIKNQYNLTVLSNLGDWAYLEKTASVSDILLIEDYLALNQKKLDEFFILKKPSVIETGCLNDFQIQSIIKKAEKFKAPVSFLIEDFNLNRLEFYQDYFVCLKIKSLNEKIISASRTLGVKGFYLALQPQTKSEIDKLEAMVRYFA